MRTSTPTHPAAAQRPPTAEMATTSGTWRLVVSFHWCEDRFEHRLVAIADPTDAAFAAGDPWPITEIAENDQNGPASNWPLNPPLQQLDECLLAGQRRGVVGLGMAGTSHWSLAVEARERELWFDVACRVQVPPGPLQSCYRLANHLSWTEVESTETGQSVLRVMTRGLRFPLASLAVDPSTTKMSLSDDRRTVCLGPRQVSEGLPATVRWRYGWIAPA